MRSATALGVSSAGWRPGATSTRRACHSSPRRSSASAPRRSRPARVRPARPAHVERLRSWLLAVSSRRPSVPVKRSRTPVLVPRYVVTADCSAYPKCSMPSARAAPKTSPSAGASVGERRGRRDRRGRRPSPARRRCRRRGRRRPRPDRPARAAASAARTRSATESSVGALRRDRARRRRRPSTSTRAITVTRRRHRLAVGGEGVAGPAQVGHAAAADDARCSRSEVERAERPLDDLLRALAHRPPSCALLRMLTPVEHRGRAHRARPARPGPAGPCRS